MKYAVIREINHAHLCKTNLDFQGAGT
jgi:hypothetical protein